MSERSERQEFVMHDIISFLPPIQVGYEIYYEHLEIEGIQDRQDAVWQFIQGSKQLLDWAQEPSNPQNPHAIKIFGVSEQVFSTKHDMLGYVPGDVAKEIVTSGLWPFLQLRLDCVYVAPQGFIAIRFQILGPIRKKHGNEKTAETSLLEEEPDGAKAMSSGHQADNEQENIKEEPSKVKRAAVFLLRSLLVLIGMGLAFVGGNVGMAAWQAKETFASMIMLLPVTLVIGGGLLIWTGIRPSSNRSTHTVTENNNS
jgi:hypothetical protein